MFSKGVSKCEISLILINQISEIFLMELLTSIFMLLGVCVVLKPIFQIFRSIYYHLKPMPNLSKIYGEKSWAVITGATDGIGYGFCQELATLGFNICLISRNAQKLQEKIEQLKKTINSNVEYKAIAANFLNSSNPQFFTSIKKEIEGMNISILVNNVGISQIQLLVNQEQKSIYNIINVNTYPMAILSQYIGRMMMKRDSRYRSGIINISSYSGIIPLPFMTVYASTKAFNDVFSISNSHEFRYQKTKIDVLSVRAMKVQSGQIKQQKSLTVPTSRQCARGSLKYLGKATFTSGHLKHQLITHLTDCLPEILLNYISLNQSKKVFEQFNTNKKQ